MDDNHRNKKKDPSLHRVRFDDDDDDDESDRIERHHHKSKKKKKKKKEQKPSTQTTVVVNPYHPRIAVINEDKNGNESIEVFHKYKSKKKKKKEQKQGILSPSNVMINPYENHFRSNSSIDDSSQSDITSSSSQKSVSSISGSSSSSGDSGSVRSEDTPMPRIPSPRSLSSSRITHPNLPEEEQERRQRQKREDKKVVKLVTMAKQQQNFAQAWFAAATSALPFNSNSSSTSSSQKRKKSYRKPKPKSTSPPVDIDTGEIITDSDEESPTQIQTTEAPPPCCVCLPDEDKMAVCYVRSHRVSYKYVFGILMCIIVAVIIFLSIAIARKNNSNPKNRPIATELPPTLKTNPPSLPPSELSSNKPSMHPSMYPSIQPSLSPTFRPTISNSPSSIPSSHPTSTPSYAPSNSPSSQPSDMPTLSSNPSYSPSATPSTYFSSTRFVPLGDVLFSDSPKDSKGYTVALSANGQIQAVGARYYPDNTIRKGSVDVYQMTDEEAWTPLGNRIEGTNEKDEFGYSIALNHNATILAASEPLANSRSGSVRVFTLNGSTWEPLGNTINTTEPFAYFGVSVALSADGTILAVGAPSAGDFNTGQVYIYQFDSNDSTWNRMGDYLEGNLYNDYFGWDVSLNGDGTFLVVGAPRRPSGGLARVFQRNSQQQWTPIGSDLTGSSLGLSHSDNRMGWSVSISDDGHRVAVGSPYYSSSSMRFSGMAIVYSRPGINNNDWVALGNTLWGVNATSQLFGWSVSISGDGNTLIVGAPGHSSRQGAAYTYKFNEHSWIVANPLVGTAPLQDFGWDVDIDQNGTTLSIGAPYERNTLEPGSVHAFAWQS